MFIVRVGGKSGLLCMDYNVELDSEEMTRGAREYSQIPHRYLEIFF